MTDVITARLRSLVESAWTILKVWIFAFGLAALGLMVACLLALVGAYLHLGIGVIKWGIATRSPVAVLVGCLPIVVPIFASALLADWEDRVGHADQIEEGMRAEMEAKDRIEKRRQFEEVRSLATESDQEAKR